MGYGFVDENSKPEPDQRCWADPPPDGEPCWGELKFIEWEGDPGGDDWQVWGCRGHANYPEGDYIPQPADQPSVK